MTPANSQIHSAFVLAHKHLRAALDLGYSANVAVGAAHIAVPNIGPGVSLPPGVQPKKFKSRHKTPASTVCKNPNPIAVSTGLVAHQPQDFGGVKGAEGDATGGGTEGDTQAEAVTEADPDNLEGISEKELEGLEEVDDPDEESKSK